MTRGSPFFVVDFFQMRNHGRRPYQAADMAYDDATVRPQHISASSLRQVQHRHLHSVKQAVGWDHGSHHRSRSDDHPRERPRCDAHRKYRAQVASEIMHLAKNDRVRRKPPDRRRSMSPAPRLSAIAASNCVSRHSPGSRRFRGQDRALWIVCAMANRPQLRRKLAADVHRRPAPASI